MSTDTSSAPAADEQGVSHIRRVLKLWVVLSVIGIIVDVIVFPRVNPAALSAVGHFNYLTNTVFTALAMPVAMFVVAFVGYSIWNFRARDKPGTPVDELEDGPNIQPTNTQTMAWLAITAFLALSTVAWGMFGFFKQTTDNPPNTMVVDVIGQQWAWTYTYPSLGVSSDVLELAKGQPVKFRVTSDDVLHGFVIPQLGVAMDANPGQWVYTPVVTPDRTATLYAHCMELCGLYHTFMWSRVNIVSKANFASWVAANGGHNTGGSASS